MQTLDNNVAVVTGGTFGVGRGIASELARHGACVFVTGRSVQDDAGNDEPITRIRCDHRVDSEVTPVFERIIREARGIDILVNNVWGGYERMVENGIFTWTKPFWEQPLWRWDAMFSAGVRAHYRASQLAAPAMIANRRGLALSLPGYGEPICADTLYRRAELAGGAEMTLGRFHSCSRLTPKVKVFLDFIKKYLVTDLDPRLRGTKARDCFTDPKRGSPALASQ